MEIDYWGLLACRSGEHSFRGARQSSGREWAVRIQSILSPCHLTAVAGTSKVSYRERSNQQSADAWLREWRLRAVPETATLAESLSDEAE